jgi:hypothetical protein
MRAIVCALRRSTGFPLDDLTFVVTHFLPHLNRDALYRILKAEGLGRLLPASRTGASEGPVANLWRSRVVIQDTEARPQQCRTKGDEVLPREIGQRRHPRQFHQVERRDRTRETWIGVHLAPPRAVGMPRSVNPLASPPKLVTPAACSSPAITGARSAARASEAA